MPILLYHASRNLPVLLKQATCDMEILTRLVHQLNALPFVSSPRTTKVAGLFIAHRQLPGKWVVRAEAY